MNTVELSLAQLSSEISSRRLSPVTVVEAFFKRIEDLNPQVTAYTLLMKDTALREAGERERELQEGKQRGPLHGIPISLKDNIATKGTRTTAGSKLLAEWIPDYDATVVERLREAGAIILGKTNLHEWAKGSSTSNPFFGTTRNPWDLERIPGGSSGGSAAAVAACMCTSSLGTDAAGSVRMPASLCGVVGLKPTFGRIPHYGVVEGSGSWSLDTIGILSRTAEDAGIMLETLAGPDSRDGSSMGLPSLEPMHLNRSLEGMKIGLAREFFLESAEGEVREGVESSVSLLEGLGMTVEEATIPHIRYAPIVWSTISRVEAWDAHSDYIRSKPQGYSRAILTRVLLGKFIDSSHYLKAQRARALINQEFDDALRKVDCIITPTTPIAAPKLDEYRSGYYDVDGKKEEVGEIYSFLSKFTIPINLTGLPAVSIPCGFTSEGMPIGVQIVGKEFDEPTVLAIAHHFGQASGLRSWKPPV